MKKIKIVLILALTMAVALALLIITQPRSRRNDSEQSTPNLETELVTAADSKNAAPKLFGIFELSGPDNTTKVTEKHSNNTRMDYDRQASQPNSGATRWQQKPKIGTIKVDHKVLELESLVDDEAYLPARVLASEMAHSSSPERRIAAANAYSWLTDGMSSKEKTAVAQEVIEMLADSEESVVLAATQTLENMLAEDPELAETFEIWRDAIATVSFDAERESLLIKLSTLSEKLSIPVILWMQESDNETLASFANDYLDFVTYGDGITNRREAEIWLANNATSSNEISVGTEMEELEESEEQTVNDSSGTTEQQAEPPAESLDNDNNLQEPVE